MKKWIIHTSVIIIITLISLNFVTAISSKGQTSPSKQSNNELEQKLNYLLNNEPALNGAIVGLSIRSAKTGELIYEHMGDIRLKPASNLKLFTAAAGLSVLGENFTFDTELLTDGKIKKHTLQGNLYLRGKGDPTLLLSDLNQLALQLKKAGIHKINGDIYGDDSWYDSIRYSRDMIWSDEQAYYGAQVSALTISPNKDYDAGTVIIEVKPNQKVGEKAKIKIIPKNNYISIDNQTITVGRDEEKDITIKREHGTNIVTISGTIPIEASNYREWVAVWEPTGLALTLFEQALKKYDIEWTGDIRTATTPVQTVKLVTHSSMPLSVIMVPFMKLSNNGHAETLIKEMGKQINGQGSWDAGIEVLMDKLSDFDINTDSLVIRDGSGISHINLVPANEISKLLFVVQKQDWFPTFLHSLPLAGAQERMVGGTLRYRLDELAENTVVRAKTGSLTTVSSLSGYIRTTSGQNLIFSILLNNLVDDAKGKMIEDKLISIMSNQ